MNAITDNVGEAIFSPVTLTHTEQPKRGHFTSLEIERILDGCRLNRRAEQKELYGKYYGYAMSISLRYSLNYDNALEMTNDAFLKIFKDLKNFAPRNNNVASSFTAWFKKVLICACIDHIRKYSKKERTNVLDQNVSVTDETETGEQILQYKEIIKCIQQLSPSYKAVFNLYVIEGFSHAEIAGKLNISESTSKSNLHKAKQNLRQFLRKRNSISYAESFT